MVYNLVMTHDGSDSTAGICSSNVVIGGVVGAHAFVLHCLCVNRDRSRQRLDLRVNACLKREGWREGLIESYLKTPVLVSLRHLDFLYSRRKSNCKVDFLSLYSSLTAQKENCSPKLSNVEPGQYLDGRPKPMGNFERRHHCCDVTSLSLAVTGQREQR